MQLEITLIGLTDILLTSYKIFEFHKASNLGEQTLTKITSCQLNIEYQNGIHINAKRCFDKFIFVSLCFGYLFEYYYCDQGTAAKELIAQSRFPE